MASVRSSRGQHAGVPGGHVVQAFRHRAPLVGASTALVPCTAWGSWRRSRPPVPAPPVHRVGIGRHVVDQTDLLGPGGGDVLAGEGQLGQVPGADDGGQPLQAPQIGHDGHLGLADREDGVGRGQPDVTGRDEVDAAPDAVAVDGGDDRLGASATAVMAAWSRRTSRAGPAGPGRPATGVDCTRRLVAVARRPPPSAGRPWP